MGTDAWFAAGNTQLIESMLTATTRVSGTVYHYVYAQDTDPQYAWMGACHGCELTFVLGLYTISMTYLSSQLPASMNANVLTFSAASQTVGNAMNGYWAGLYHNANPNWSGSGLPTWAAMAPADKQTMTFQGYYSHGALMNPCVRWASCRTEQTKDWRYTKKHFWSSSPTTTTHTYMTEPVCTSAPAGFTSHTNGASVGLNCSFMPCCRYTTGRRSLLFGMPSTTTSTTCDSMC